MTVGYSIWVEVQQSKIKEDTLLDNCEASKDQALKNDGVPGIKVYVQRKPFVVFDKVGKG